MAPQLATKDIHSIGVEFNIRAKVFIQITLDIWFE